MARVPPVCWPNGLFQLPTSPLADLPAQVPNPIRLWWPAERLAVQRRHRRTNGSLMLLRFPCGGVVRCNGLFDGASRVIAAYRAILNQGPAEQASQRCLRCEFPHRPAPTSRTAHGEDREVRAHQPRSEADRKRGELSNLSRKKVVPNPESEEDDANGLLPLLARPLNPCVLHRSFPIGVHPSNALPLSGAGAARAVR